jgi:hypothetical protein
LIELALSERGCIAEVGIAEVGKEEAGIEEVV